jgi:hypothetical protein
LNEAPDHYPLRKPRDDAIAYKRAELANSAFVAQESQYRSAVTPAILWLSVMNEINRGLKLRCETISR